MKTVILSKSKSAWRFLAWYFSLPVMKKCVGILDKYCEGKVRHIDFLGECCIVWVEYKMKTKAYRGII